MKKVLLLSFIGISVLYTSVIAQTPTTPKINSDSLKLIAQISQDQYKLSTLQNMVDQKTKNKQDAAANAKTSANDNATAAEKLTDNPDDKKLAKNADKKAGNARSDARKSRKETQRLDNLNTEIRDLKGKIANEQAKLATYVTTATAAAPAYMLVPVQTDSIRHP